MADTAHLDDLTEHRDSADTLQAKVKQLADLIRASNHTVIFTGAGISTSADIPDFRGASPLCRTSVGLRLSLRLLVDGVPLAVWLATPFPWPCPGCGRLIGWRLRTQRRVDLRGARASGPRWRSDDSSSANSVPHGQQLRSQQTSHMLIDNP